MSSMNQQRDVSSSAWQARLKHLADNLGPGIPGGTRQGVRSRATAGAAGSWLGRARVRATAARPAHR